LSGIGASVRYFCYNKAIIVMRKYRAEREF